MFVPRCCHKPFAGKQFWKFAMRKNVEKFSWWGDYGPTTVSGTQVRCGTSLGRSAFFGRKKRGERPLRADLLRNGVS